MPDLKWIVEKVIQENPQVFSGDFSEDLDMIEAIDNRIADTADRINRMKEWLRSYSVVRPWKTEIRLKIAGQILSFADIRKHECLGQDQDLIISEFLKLKEMILVVVPISEVTGKKREVTSLTSKALWCCYPHDIPILDDYAERALQVISRILRLAPATEKPRYSAFVDVWFQVYDEIKLVIDKPELNKYKYKVRVLDKLLWYLGQHSFDKPHP
jgi:hypothetical protein